MLGSNLKFEGGEAEKGEQGRTITQHGLCGTTRRESLSLKCVDNKEDLNRKMALERHEHCSLVFVHENLPTDELAGTKWVNDLK